MGRYSWIVFTITVLLMDCYTGMCQDGYDTSNETKDLVRKCRTYLDNYQPTFSTVPLLIPLRRNDFSAGFSGDNNQVIISRSFLYWAIDTLALAPLHTLDNKGNQLDYRKLTADQVQVALQGVLCHEFGHFLQKIYNDTLLNTMGDADPLLKQQQREYVCDFISGFTSGKTLWMQIRQALFNACAGEKPENIIMLIWAVYSYDTPKLDPAFSCLEKFVLPYRNADLLINLGDCSHGLGKSRKNAYDAGIFYSIFDGIARETFEDKEVMKGLDPLITLMGITRDKLKSTFADNLTKYLTQHKGMNNAIDRKLRTYSVLELYLSAFNYCLSLEKNQDQSCGIGYEVKLP